MQKDKETEKLIRIFVASIKTAKKQIVLNTCIDFPFNFKIN